MTVYRLIHAERKYCESYTSEDELLQDQNLIGRSDDGWPILEGFEGPHPYWQFGERWVGYVAIRPDEPDALNTSAWEACP